MSSSPFDWSGKGKSVFIEDKKFNGVNQKKAESSSKVLEVNREASQLDLGKRNVTPYQVAGPYKHKPPKYVKKTKES
jgi:hypothetical protein